MIHVHVLIDAQGNGIFVRNLRFEDGWETAYLPGPLCACLRLDGVAGGVWYTEELSGPDGMDFTLIAEPDTTDEQIAEAKHILRFEREMLSTSTWCGFAG